MLWIGQPLPVHVVLARLLLWRKAEILIERREVILGGSKG
jgi:hypothetical protein